MILADRPVYGDHYVTGIFPRLREIGGFTYIAIYLLFPHLLDYYNVSKCEIKFERILENYISRLHISLVCFISHGPAKTKLATMAFLYWVEIVKISHKSQ